MVIASLMHDLHPRTVAARVSIPHDRARMTYPTPNSVNSLRDFEDEVGRYVQHHYRSCIVPGGSLSLSDARSMGKEMVEREYRRRKGNIVSAYRDVCDGVVSLRAILDIIADALKEEAIVRYTKDVIDRHVDRSNYEEIVACMRELIATCGPHLGTEFQTNRPERYAGAGWEDLIKTYVEALKSTAAVVRRM